MRVFSKTKFFLNGSYLVRPAGLGLGSIPTGVALAITACLWVLPLSWLHAFTMAACLWGLSWLLSFVMAASP